MNNEMISFEEFKKDLEELTKKGREPEIPFLVNGHKYMIIGFKDRVSFQRFGDSIEEQSGEVYFKTIDELYHTKTIDGVLLERDWGIIERLNDHDLI